MNLSDRSFKVAEVIYERGPMSLGSIYEYLKTLPEFNPVPKPEVLEDPKISKEDPPFKSGDFVVCEGTGWSYVPIQLKYNLHRKSSSDTASEGFAGDWLYGANNVKKSQMRLATAKDLDRWSDQLAVDLGVIRERAKKLREFKDYLSNTAEHKK